MDEHEFERLLQMFPVVRSPDYRVDLDSSNSSQSTSRPPLPHHEESENLADFDGQDAFWGKLKLVAERKMGPADAKRFCDAFQRVHRKLVYEELSLDAVKSLLNSITTSG